MSGSALASGARRAARAFPGLGRGYGDSPRLAVGHSRRVLCEKSVCGRGYRMLMILFVKGLA